jgi:hypothetical protein
MSGPAATSPDRRRSRRVRAATIRAALAFLCVLPSAAAAQRSSIDAGLIGRVLDEATEIGIADAFVEFIDGQQRVRARTVTDDEGHFVLQRLPPGTFALRVSRYGYMTTTTPSWRVQTGEVLSVIVRMDPETILLAPLEIYARARSASPVLSGFYHRLERGIGGIFFTRDDIERRKPSRLTDLLADVPGLRLDASGAGHERTVTFTRTILAPDSARRCPVQVFVDGLLATRGESTAPIDDLVSPQSLEGMEVYRGMATIPPEFLNQHARCGVIALWTRRGG